MGAPLGPRAARAVVRAAGGPARRPAAPAAGLMDLGLAGRGGARHRRLARDRSRDRGGAGGGGRAGRDRGARRRARARRGRRLRRPRRGVRLRRPRRRAERDRRRRGRARARSTSTSPTPAARPPARIRSASPASSGRPPTARSSSRRWRSSSACSRDARARLGPRGRDLLDGRPRADRRPAALQRPPPGPDRGLQGAREAGRGRRRDDQLRPARADRHRADRRQLRLARRGGGGGARDTVPAGRLGTADELAAAAIFLCSAPASYITGTTLLVDGGLSASV